MAAPTPVLPDPLRSNFKSRKRLALYNMSVGVTVEKPNTLTPGLVIYAEFSFLNVSTDGRRV